MQDLESHLYLFGPSVDTSIAAILPQLLRGPTPAQNLAQVWPHRQYELQAQPFCSTGQSLASYTEELLVEDCCAVLALTEESAQNLQPAQLSKGTEQKVLLARSEARLGAAGNQ